MPEQIKIYPSTQAAILAQPHATLLITDRLIEQEEEVLLENGVIYRPKSVVLGMGCNRGTSVEEIEQLIDETLAELKLWCKGM
ncbi:Cobalamin biosynthesis protein CbiG OS=Lysinibacillus sphaericus OX=1421 GN=LS41612_09490 PE=4 SV=1 [Lysinibacillus sphaericus]